MFIKLSDSSAHAVVCVAPIVLNLTPPLPRHHLGPPMQILLILQVFSASSPQIEYTSLYRQSAIQRSPNFYSPSKN